LPHYALQYLRYAGPGYAVFGPGLTLLFSLHGAGKVRGPVIGLLPHLTIIVSGGASPVTPEAVIRLFRNMGSRRCLRSRPPKHARPFLTWINEIDLPDSYTALP
jgi:hypothetical protein